MDTMTEIARIGVVPVIKLDDPDHAIPLAEALKAGDIPLAEVTFRTPTVVESLRRISQEVRTFSSARALC